MASGGPLASFNWKELMINVSDGDRSWKPTFESKTAEDDDDGGEYDGDDDDDYELL